MLEIRRATKEPSLSTVLVSSKFGTVTDLAAHAKSVNPDNRRNNSQLRHV